MKTSCCIYGSKYIMFYVLYSKKGSVQIMKGTERRQEILHLLANSSAPVPATTDISEFLSISASR